MHMPGFAGLIRVEARVRVGWLRDVLRAVKAA
jgi:hypothetical protein